jgi:hypothetical protein
MKEELRKHIAEIFKSVDLDSKFEIFEVGVDFHPTLAQYIGITRRFLVCAAVASAKERLETLTGKQLTEQNGIVCWSEGERIVDAVKFPSSDASDSINSVRDNGDEQFIPSSVVLPEWLDQRIFVKMGCNYTPSGTAKEFNRNLDLPLIRIMQYIGTYLPRSYAEANSIFNDLFSNKAIRKAYSKRKKLKALCIGSGTGGDTLGFLDAITQNFPSVTSVQIIAFEGNTDAISISAALVEEAKSHLNYDVDFKIVNHVFKGFYNAETELDGHYIVSGYDFVFTSKMINELISSTKEGTSNSYGDFTRTFLPLLKDTGLLMILDITSKPEPVDIFAPQLMNNQVNKELREMSGFQTILPIPCGQHEELCDRNCFTQKNYYVSHSQKQLDKSKVCFRVIARTEFAAKVSKSNKDNRYIIVDDKKDYCPYDSASQHAVGTFCFNNSSKIDNEQPQFIPQITVSADWKSALAELFDEEAQKYAYYLIKNSVVAPSIIGYELLDKQGRVTSEAEMVWEAERIAFVLPHQIGGRDLFEENGWTVITCGDSFPVNKGDCA